MAVKDNSKLTRSAPPNSSSQHQSHSISTTVIIPTYNERENIIPVIQQCQEALQQYDSEIIVVDDDSPDQTWAVVQENYQSTPNIRVVRRQHESGLATAVARGFTESMKDTCVVIDGDLQHPPEEIPALIDAIDKGADIAIGSRYLPDGEIQDWQTKRHLISHGAIYLAKLVLPSARNITDPVSGFFALRTELLSNVPLNPQGYKILLEILTKCNWDTCTEIPYTFTNREQGESSLVVEEYVNFLGHLGQLSLIDRNLDAIVEPKRAIQMVEFGLIGASGAIVNTIVFFITHSMFSLHYLLSGGLAFFAAVNWNFMGNWFLTFDQPEGNRLRQYLSFLGVCFGGFVVYSLSLAILLSLFSFPALASNTCAIVAGAVVNYIGAENLVFVSTPVIIKDQKSPSTVKEVFNEVFKR